MTQKHFHLGNAKAAKQNRRGRLWAAALLGILALPGLVLPARFDGAASVDGASLAILNARIWTGNPQQPWAQAAAISGDRILSVGDNEVIRGILQTTTHVFDGGGNTVTPGFIDCHFHIIDVNAAGGTDPISLRLVTTRKGFAGRVAKYSTNKPEGTWIFGEGWDERKWGGELPSKEWIDLVTPHNPVWLTRAFGGVGLANSAALRAAGITRDTAEPPAGGIVRDSRGTADPGARGRLPHSQDIPAHP